MGLDRRGFTLVEVLAVSVIFVFLLASISAVFLFGQKAFYSGSQNANLHSALRQTAERINRELRFAFFLELIDESVWDIDSVDPAEYSYIYLDRETNALILLNEKGSRPLSEGVITNVSFFGNVSTLIFTLEAESGGKEYSLESSVRLLNYRCNFSNPENPAVLRFSLDPDFEPEE